jgi:hypothetical protein
LAFAIFCPLGGSTCFAQWQPEEIGLVRNFNQTVHTAPGVRGTFDGPYMSSLLDALDLLATDKPLDQKKYPHSDIEISLSEKFFVKPDGTPMPLPATYFPAQGTKRASLVVYLPGIFQDKDDHSSHQAIRELLGAGNSVLFIPNPLTADYMRNFPRSPPANFVAEAGVTLAAIDSFVSLHVDEIAGVHIAGASYGAFVAAIVIAKDAEREHPVINGQATLIFPPFQMAQSRERLDQMVDQYQDGHWSAAALIAKKFQQALIGLLGRMKEKYLADKANGFVARRYRPGAATFLMGFDPVNPEQTDGVRFYTVIYKAIEVTAPFYSSERADIGYWLNQAADHGNTRARILTTDDDWLNNPGMWKSLPAWMRNESHLLIHKGGGHAGIVSSDWLASFVLQSMRVRPGTDR